MIYDRKLLLDHTQNWLTEFSLISIIITFHYYFHLRNKKAKLDSWLFSFLYQGWSVVENSLEFFFVAGLLLFRLFWLLVSFLICSTLFWIGGSCFCFLRICLIFAKLTMKNLTKIYHDCVSLIYEKLKSCFWKDLFYI